jgi:hypothetical protein
MITIKNTLLAASVLFLTNARSQDDFKKHNLHAFTGMEWHKFSTYRVQAEDFNVEYSATDNPRVYAGLEYWYRLNAKHSFSAGLSFHYMGISARQDFINDSMGLVAINTGVTGNAVQIPILYRQTVKMGSGWLWDIFAGPVLCFQSNVNKKEYNGDYNWIRYSSPEFRNFARASTEDVVVPLVPRFSGGMAFSYKGFRFSGGRTWSLKDNLNPLYYNFRSSFINNKQSTWNLQLSYFYGF